MFLSNFPANKFVAILKIPPFFRSTNARLKAIRFNTYSDLTNQYKFVQTFEYDCILLVKSILFKRLTGASTFPFLNKLAFLTNDAYITTTFLELVFLF